MSIEASRLIAVIDGDANGAIRAYDAAEARGQKSAAAMAKTARASETAIKVGVAGIALAFGLAVAQATDFDKQMSSVQAKASASTSEFAAMRKEAIQLGADTALSSSKAAQGMDVLAAAGFNAQQIMAATPGTINAAIAAGGDLAQTTEYMAATMRQFNLEASQMGHIGDVFAKAANVSNASISDLGVSMKYTGPVASTLGFSLEETSSALALLANQGFKADMAGTGLRMGLLKLNTITPIVEKRLGKVGKGLQDSLRAAPTLATKLDVLRNVMAKMSKEEKVGFLQKLVGVEAAPQMLTLLNQTSGAMADMTKQLTNSDGAAKAAADTMMDNLYGSIEQLKGSTESAAISIGTALTPQIRGLTDGIRTAVNGFNALPAAEQQALIKNVAVVGAFAAGALAAVKFAKAVMALQMAVGAAGGPVGLLYAAIGVLGGIVGGAVIEQTVFGNSLSGTAAAAQDAARSLQDYKLALDDVQGKKLEVGEAENALAQAKLSKKQATKYRKTVEKTSGKGSDLAQGARLAEDQTILQIEVATRRLAKANGELGQSDVFASGQALAHINQLKAQGREAMVAATKSKLVTDAVMRQGNQFGSGAKGAENLKTQMLDLGRSLAEAGVPPEVIASYGRSIAQQGSLQGAAKNATDYIAKLHARLAKTPKDKQTKIKVAIKDAQKELAIINAAMNRTARPRTATITARVVIPSSAESRLNRIRKSSSVGGEAIGHRLSAVPGGHLRVLAEAGSAEYAIPMNGSARSRALWESAGRELGVLKETTNNGGITIQNLSVVVPDGKVATFERELRAKVSNGSRRLAVGV